MTDPTPDADTAEDPYRGSMSSEPTRHAQKDQKTVPTTASAQHDEGAVARAVEFVRLLSTSSLGTPDAREDRLAGRREFEEMERVSSGVVIPGLTDDERDFDLRVASELELRDQTFEAELRYRAVLKHDEPAKPLTHLALLLESKGFYRRALPLYVCAAQAREPNALFRLANISYQVGKAEWSRDFIDLGSASLEPEQAEKVSTVLTELDRNRDAPDLGRFVTGAATQADSIDATFAAGTMLLAGGRIDLARLTYCTALARGHSLAAISLLNLSPRRRAGSLQYARSFLDQMWSDEFGPDARSLRRDRPGLIRLGVLAADLGAPPWMSVERSAGNWVGTSLDLLRNVRPQDRNRLLAEKGASGRSVVREPWAARSGAAAAGVQRILLLARTITTLRGFNRVGYDETSLSLIETAGNRLCKLIVSRFRSDFSGDADALIGEVWDKGTIELRRAKAERRRLPDISAEKVFDAGVVRRFGRAVDDLSEPQQQALVLDLAGLGRDEIGSGAKLGSGRDVRDLLRSAVDRLHLEQQGEQFDPMLWRMVEKCFAEIPGDLKEALSYLPEPDVATRA